MSEIYKKMLDSTFGEYYERFKELDAVSRETAVTIKELFPNNRPLSLRSRMHKMLSMGIVKREGLNRYWLDEDTANDSRGVLKQRILIVIIAILLAILLIMLEEKGIISL